MERSPHQQDLHDLINSAISISELHKLLSFMDLSAVKQFVREQVDQLDSETMIAAHHCSLPINNVLSENVTQHVLSFTHCNQNRDVCKSWNDLQKQTERNMLRSACQKGLAKASSSANGRNLVLHRRRPYVHNEEFRNGFHGTQLYGPTERPFWNLGEISCGRGDRILVHEGSYHLHAYSNPNFQAGTHFIGCSPRASIKFDGIVHPAWRNVSFSDLQLHCLNWDAEAVIVENCTITLDLCSIEVHGNGSLVMKNCSIKKSDLMAVLIDKTDIKTRPAIKIWPKARNVHIESCDFIGYDKVYEIAEHGKSTTTTKTVQITNVNNKLR